MECQPRRNRRPERIKAQLFDAAEKTERERLLRRLRNREIRAMSNEDHAAVERMCDITAEQFALAKARRGAESKRAMAAAKLCQA